MPSRAVTVRFDEKEYARLEANAERLGVSRVSYIRFLVSLDFPTFVPGEDEPSDEELAGTLVVPFIDKSDIEAIRLELARQGNNHNQGAKALNQLAHLARENKALRIDWQSYCGVAERALYESSQSLKTCVKLFKRLANESTFDCRTSKSRRV